MATLINIHSKEGAAAVRGEDIMPLIIDNKKPVNKLMTKEEWEEMNKLMNKVIWLTKEN